MRPRQPRGGDEINDFIVGTQDLNGYARVFVSKIIFLGDGNKDGFVNFSDIPAFIEILIAS